MSREQANLFFQVVAQRYEKGSMILASTDFWQLGLSLRRRRRAHGGDAGSHPPSLDHRQHQRRELPPQGQAQGRHPIQTDEMKAL